MANKFYAATALTGGGEGALDAIDGANVADGDGAVVIAAGTAYFYRLDGTSGAAESSPSVIAPDANAGDKRWILQQIYSDGGSVLDDDNLAANGGDVLTNEGSGTYTMHIDTNGIPYLQEV
jgi:hypothetical protein